MRKDKMDGTRKNTVEASAGDADVIPKTTKTSNETEEDPGTEETEKEPERVEEKRHDGTNDGTNDEPGDGTNNETNDEPDDGTNNETNDRSDDGFNDELTSTPYDDVFRTMLNDASQLILPVLNEVFGKHYTGSEKIVFTKETHFMNRQDGRGQRRISDSSFSVVAIEVDYYLMELQSRPDSSMLIRFFEYGTQVALDEGQLEGNVLKVRIPNCAVLFLRSTKNTPDQMEVQLSTPGGDVTFQVMVMKVQQYKLDEIFDKQLYFLIPFYIFSREKNFAEYEADAGKMELLKKEYVTIMNRLESLETEGKISAYDRSLIVEMSGEVLRHIAAKYDKVKSEVKKIMGGRILDYETKRIYQKGRADERKISDELLAEEKRRNEELLAEKKRSEAALEEQKEKQLEDKVRFVRSVIKEFGASLDQAMSIANVAECDREAVVAAVTLA